MKNREKATQKQADFTFAHREEGFDNHIESSIRGYGNLHDDVVALSRYFVEEESDVYDIGSSTGKTIAAMAKQNHSFAPKTCYIGIENAAGFKDDMTKRVEEVETDNPGTQMHFVYDDVRNVKIENACLVTSIFTLQFMPPNSRREVLQKIYNGLNYGGAFIFAEKTVAKDARLQEMLTFNYYDYKRKSFSTDDIMDKERTLRNMLKPNTWQELTSMLACVGFDIYKIQPFWQNHLFVGAIAIK